MDQDAPTQKRAIPAELREPPAEAHEPHTTTKFRKEDIEQLLRQEREKRELLRQGVKADDEAPAKRDARKDKP